jgi:hypothetical protein
MWWTRSITVATASVSVIRPMWVIPGPMVTVTLLPRACSSGAYWSGSICSSALPTMTVSGSLTRANAEVRPSGPEDSSLTDRNNSE